MPSIPLFQLGNGPTLGLNGINQALQVQANNLALQQAVRDNARDFIDFSSQLDSLGQFADFREQGLTPSQALFAQSQGSLNPLTSQAGLNNFVNRTGQLAPFAIEAARNGNPGLFQGSLGAAGIQFDPRNPTSGFGGLGAEGIGAQTNFNIRNNLLGGALNNPAAQAQGVPQLNPVQPPQQFQSGFAANQPQVVQQRAPQQTTIQQNAAVIRAVQAATQPTNPNGVFAGTNQAQPRNAAVSNPQTQRQEAVTQPAPLPTLGQRRFTERRRRDAQQAVGFRSIYDF